MFIRIVRHWCKEGRVEDGRAHMEKVGAATAGAPGFVFRYCLEQAETPDVLTTLTAWRDEASFEAFRAGRPAHDASDPAFPFAQVEAETFSVFSALGDDRFAAD